MNAGSETGIAAWFYENGVRVVIVSVDTIPWTKFRSHFF